MRVAPALDARRANDRRLNRPHSKKGASRQMHLRAAPEAENAGIVAV
ncbi:hypothetical protein A2U01_0056399 [Trifolium medium]|uniref:Uncharacterized protein n=1 Tax=Trifolium medium TaxID=97028 RepID=A0A392REZ0_9FABA|nr:hypothetical protein [Trifolium medium]